MTVNTVRGLVSDEPLFSDFSNAIAAQDPGK